MGELEKRTLGEHGDGDKGLGSLVQLLSRILAVSNNAVGGYVLSKWVMWSESNAANTDRASPLAGQQSGWPRIESDNPNSS